MIERTTITFVGLEHPAYEARGASGGPHVALIGGIHGCEYSSIAAVTRFMNELDSAELVGSITAVPVVSMQSFRQRSAFVVPEDGKNLNRTFPGSYEGTYTDALARSIFDQRCSLIGSEKRLSSQTGLRGHHGSRRTNGNASRRAWMGKTGQKSRAGPALCAIRGS